MNLFRRYLRRYEERGSSEESASSEALTDRQEKPASEEEDSTKSEGSRELTGYSAKVVLWVAVAMTAYHLYIAFAGVPEPFRLRPIHLGFAMFLGFALYPFSKKRGSRNHTPWYDWFLALLSLGPPIYIQLNYEDVTERYPYLTTLSVGEWVFGVLLILLILELTRRIVGWGLVILALFFLGHSLFGPYLPGDLYHPGVSLNQLVDHVYLTNTGVYGSIVGISATFIFLFIVFGTFLQSAGASQFFMNMAISVTKRARGGPAKASTISSAFFGMISGSAVANVFTTGAITIPLMIKTGFKRHFAGGVEAVSSASGQVMPPIMGSAAFLIAEFTGVEYIEVALAAAIPSLLYLFAIYWMVHFQALRSGLPSYRDADLPNMREVFRRDAHLLIPIFLLVYLLLQRYTPYFAAFYAILALTAISFVRAHTRLDWEKLVSTMANAAKKGTPIAVVIGCAGLIVATTTLTGLPYKFTASILSWSGGYLPVALVLVGVATIILGMDLPIVVAFIIASLFGVPALLELGVDRFVAHMFIFYYAILATITPPVCMTAYSAATIAGASMWKTGITAVQIGIAAYILPIMFVYNPSLLYQGDLFKSLTAAVSAAIGIIALASAVQGFLIARSHWYERVAMGVIALLFLKPGFVTDAIGLSVLALIVLLQTTRIKTSPIKALLGRGEVGQPQEQQE
jgi:TRAP transporter 4TM/12TM fusion protein